MNSGAATPAHPAALALTRRAALTSAVTLAICRAAAAEPSAMPVAPSLLVAGPSGGRVDRWATLIGEPLGRSLLQHASLAQENIGGPDGVIGVNQFQAQTTADGATALLMPGTAALSWLVGDPRVHFDPGRWAPLWGGEASALIASRVPLSSGRSAGRPIGVAVHNFVGPELAALLALELLGLPANAVRVDAPGGTPPSQHPDVDMTVLHGAELKREAAELTGRGWTIACSLGVLGEDGTVARDPMFPAVPTLYELVDASTAPRTAELAAALRAVGAAAALDIALVLPLLSPAAVVAWWRQGCTTLASAPEVVAEAARRMVRPVEAGPMAATFATITADTPVLLALRRWLVERHHWQPA